MATTAAGSGGEATAVTTTGLATSNLAGLDKLAAVVGGNLVILGETPSGPAPTLQGPITAPA